MSDRLVIIPTYEERENIREIIDAVLGLPDGYHVLVVDDGSPDGTAALVKQAQTIYLDRLHLIERSGKLGLGTAYITGFNWGLERDFDFLFEMDADFSHAPNDVPRLLEACSREGVGMSVGSRYVKGGSVKDWDMKRVIMSWGASLYVRAVLGLGVKDTTAGFVCYRAEVLRAIPLQEVRFIGYAFQIEMKYRVKRLGWKIAEVPITFADRRKGRSKMSMGIFKEAFWGVLQMRRHIA